MNPAILLACCPLLAAGTAFADGIPLRDGRYAKASIAFTLSVAQRKTIAHFRSCHWDRLAQMNEFSPHVFELTPDQAKKLKRRVGFAPRRFQVFETFRGDNDGGPHWNVALRFNDDQFEVPLDLLLQDSKAVEASRTLGWKSNNPCFPQVTE